jgi:hypothetical protein
MWTDGQTRRSSYSLYAILRACLKSYITHTDVRRGLYSAGFEYDLMVDFCEHGSEPSDTKVAGNFLHSRGLYECLCRARWIDFSFFMARQPQWGLGFLIVEVSRSHSDTPHSVGLLWRSDRPVAETSDNTNSQETVMSPAGFEFSISEGERPQTHAVDRAATGIVRWYYAG